MEGETVEHVRLGVKSLSDGDQGTVETVLGHLPGVESVRFGDDGQAIDVQFDPRVVDLNGIRRALQDNGYPADSVDYAAPRDEPND